MTRYQRLKPNAVKTWKNFESLFKEMKGRISFWLFQMPPNFVATSENMMHRNSFDE